MHVLKKVSAGAASRGEPADNIAGWRKHEPELDVLRTDLDELTASP